MRIVKAYLDPRPTQSRVTADAAVTAGIRRHPPRGIEVSLDSMSQFLADEELVLVGDDAALSSSMGCPLETPGSLHTRIHSPE
jgi:hypothetical protein